MLYQALNPWFTAMLILQADVTDLIYIYVK